MARKEPELVITYACSLCKMEFADPRAFYEVHDCWKESLAKGYFTTYQEALDHGVSKEDWEKLDRWMVKNEDSLGKLLSRIPRLSQRKKTK